ncbi:hypothetical protein ACFXO9_19530 [Nocardia tengchongensis]|uniref:hypothetical protein n=1 Tax=Nocardia tengchongensis TaxID=2055889 RepID=UPI003681FBFB
MFTLHISHQVNDYDTWKAAFDTFDEVRRDNGVLAYRIARGEPGGNHLHIDLDFGTRDQARAFSAVLEGIWRRPRAAALLVGDRTAEIRDLAEQHTLV